MRVRRVVVPLGRIWLLNRFSVVLVRRRRRYIRLVGVLVDATVGSRPAVLVTVRISLVTRRGLKVLVRRNRRVRKWRILPVSGLSSLRLFVIRFGVIVIRLINFVIRKALL